MSNEPLEGVTVVDLAVARAGPTCVRQLADLGADVVQVAAPRGVAAFASGGSDGQNLHRNKRSVVLDLTLDAGRDVLLRLVEQADVLVENFRPSVKYKLRIDPDTLWALNPRLVYASISGFGQDGPYADYPGVDQIAQGLGGLMSVTGPPGTGPSRAGIAISDTAAGTILTQGVLAALIARERTGRGQWVRTSLLEAMISFMDFQATRWLIDGDVPGQVGNQHPTIVPMGAYPTADGYVNVSRARRLRRLLRADRRTRARRRPPVRRRQRPGSRTVRSSTARSPTRSAPAPPPNGWSDSRAWCRSDPCSGSTRCSRTRRCSTSR